MKNKVIPQLLIITTRYLLRIAFVFASIIKIKGLRFTSTDGINRLNNRMRTFEFKKSKNFEKYLI